MGTIDDLTRKVQSLEGQLDAARKSLHDARLADCGLVPGVTLLTYDDKPFLFIAVRNWSFAKPWVYGRSRKKDGTWGERETLLYGDWKLAEAEPAR